MSVRGRANRSGSDPYRPDNWSFNRDTRSLSMDATSLTNYSYRPQYIPGTFDYMENPKIQYEGTSYNLGFPYQNNEQQKPNF